MCTTRRVHSNDDGIFKRMEAIEALSNLINIIGALADHVVTVQQLAQEDRRMHTENMIPMNKSKVRNAIVSIFGVTKDIMAAW